ncbi:MAG: TolC family protein [Bacteroidota bacterium]
MKRIKLIIYFTISCLCCFGQADTLRLSLDHILEIALDNALDLKTAESQIKENQLVIQRLQEQIRPRLFANATLPNLSRAIELRPLPDGRDAFVNRSTMNNRLELSLYYEVIATGGTLIASSSLDRLDIFKSDLFDYNRTYFFTPIAVSLQQPVFRFNELKWQKERYDLIDAELVASQAVVREDVFLKAVQYYNQAYQAQIDIAISQNKIKETQALYEIKSRQAAIAKAQRVELLRLASEQQSNQIEYEQSILTWNEALMQLCDFLQLKQSAAIRLEAPPDIAMIKIDTDFAISLATQNSHIQAKNTLRIKTAEAEIQRNNMDNGLEVSIDLSLGLNKSDEQFSQLYTELLDRQTAAISLSVPLNGGKQRQLNRAIAAEQLLRERLEIEQEITDITRNVRTGVQAFNLLVRRIEVEQQNRAVSDEIYELVRQQFTLGRKGIIDLNIARAEQEAALKSYYSTLLRTIEKYYELRKLCLYDFLLGKRLTPSG